MVERVDRFAVAGKIGDKVVLPPVSGESAAIGSQRQQCAAHFGDEGVACLAPVPFVKDAHATQIDGDNGAVFASVCGVVHVGGV